MHERNYETNNNKWLKNFDERPRRRGMPHATLLNFMLIVKTFAMPLIRVFCFVILDIHLCTTFDDTIASAVLEIWLVPSIYLYGSRYLTTPPSGMVCRLWAGTCYTNNMSAKFEVSICTHYENMKGDAKCRNWGGLGVVRGHSRSLNIAPFDRTHTRVSLLAFNSNYVPSRTVSEI